ncbi:beta-lactamase family protein [Tissierella pigra]|uniref:serine hydrolase domain-containing protein n=1 Tax=Tissierella pigra TaxID=2607614 RepID=UPI001C1009AD|nr:serine hydrolase [Tissierella pigra]MBU5425065.1 beta-lactamase family protein [Tissierella pigra]
MTIIKTKRFEKVFNKYASSKKINEGILLIENTSGEFSLMKRYGEKELNSPLLMASITKLFTTTCILILLEQNKLSLEDKIVNYFDINILKGIHVYKGREYSFELTVSDLLFQTSGLPDVYLEGENSLINRIIQEDFHINFCDTISSVKKLKPHFKPRKKGKAYYADINFDILGQIVEKESGLTLSKAYEKYIFEPLRLVNTYLPEDRYNEIPKIYYMNQIIHRPKFVISSGASGGCITTAQELMIFIKAFFRGKLLYLSTEKCTI